MLSIIMLCYIKILLINFIKYHSSCIHLSHISLVMIKIWLLSRKRKRCGLTSWPTWPDLPLRSVRSGQERGKDVVLPADLPDLTYLSGQLGQVKKEEKMWSYQLVCTLSVFTWFVGFLLWSIFFTIFSLKSLFIADHALKFATFYINIIIYNCYFISLCLSKAYYDTLKLQKQNM